MASPDAQLYALMNATALGFIDSYVKSHKAKDPTILSSDLTSSCRRYLAPESLLKQAPQLSAGWSNAEYEQHMRPEIEGYSTVEAKVKEITIDTYKRKAVVHSLHICTMAKDERQWTFEFMFELWFDDSGTKIKQIKEFVDTAVAVEMMTAYGM